MVQKTHVSRRKFIQTAAKGVFVIGTAAPYLNCSYSIKPDGITSPKGTGYIYDGRMLNHEISSGHVESPERLIRIQELMKTTGLAQDIVNLPLLDDPFSYIRKIHTNDHISAIRGIPDTGLAAEIASAGVLGAAKAVCEGTVRNAFCAIRPPGHHANNTGSEEGFCYYNNVAVAARFVQEVYKIDKVLIIDWDYHHGNGTQNAFYNDGSVLFFSTHNLHAYPGTGNPSLKGEGEGYGLNINVHLDEYADDDDMKRSWDNYLIPRVETFKPDFVFISAGFDSRINDRLGHFNITDDCFAYLTECALEFAETYAQGRLVSLLEGGYNIDGTASATVTHLAKLLDKSL